MFVHVKTWFMGLVLVAVLCSQGLSSPATDLLEQWTVDGPVGMVTDAGAGNMAGEGLADQSVGVGVRFTEVPDDCIVPSLPARPSLPGRTTSLPGLPSTLLLTFAGFLCITLVRDRRVWAAAVVAGISLSQAGLHSLPRLIAGPEPTSVTRVVGHGLSLIDGRTSPAMGALRTEGGAEASVRLSADGERTPALRYLAFLPHFGGPCVHAESVLTPSSERGPPVAA